MKSCKREKEKESETEREKPGKKRVDSLRNENNKCKIVERKTKWDAINRQDRNMETKNKIKKKTNGERCSSDEPTKKSVMNRRKQGKKLHNNWEFNSTVTSMAWETI